MGLFMCWCCCPFPSGFIRSRESIVPVGTCSMEWSTSSTVVWQGLRCNIALPVCMSTRMHYTQLQQYDDNICLITTHTSRNLDVFKIAWQIQNYRCVVSSRFGLHRLSQRSQGVESRESASQLHSGFSCSSALKDQTGDRKMNNNCIECKGQAGKINSLGCNGCGW